MHLLCIRHAQAEGNLDGVMLGQLDPDLSQQGVLQAQGLATQLAQGDWRPTHIYTSPLRRSRRTAEIAMAAIGESLGQTLPILESSLLQEVHLGIFQGLRWDQAQEHYPDLCAQLERSPQWLAIPSAESPVALHQRAVDFLAGLRDRHGREDRLWIFSHGGFLQYLVAAILGCDRVWGLSIPNTAVFEFELAAEDWMAVESDRWNPTCWKILRFNDLPSHSDDSGNAAQSAAFPESK